jgi:hypothetical protein
VVVSPKGTLKTPPSEYPPADLSPYDRGLSGEVLRDSTGLDPLEAPAGLKLRAA